MAKVVGITGLVASGKSTLANYLKNKGYRIFDCDSNVKQIYQDSYFLKQLQIIFPDVFKNNLLDKNLLANKIYNNRIEKVKLESLIHPIVEQNCDVFIKENKREKIIFLEVPLLFEVGWDKKCSQIILVMVDDKNKLKERFLKRGGTKSMFTNILKNQSNTEFKIKNSNYVIYNNSSIEDFYLKIDTIEKQILGLY